MTPDELRKWLDETLAWQEEQGKVIDQAMAAHGRLHTWRFAVGLVRAGCALGWFVAMNLLYWVRGEHPTAEAMMLGATVVVALTGVRIQLSRMMQRHRWTADRTMILMDLRGQRLARMCEEAKWNEKGGTRR